MTRAGDYVLPATWYAAREARGESTHDLDVEMAAVAGKHWKKEQT
jgi:hypothetical protein